MIQRLLLITLLGVALCGSAEAKPVQRRIHIQKAERRLDYEEDGKVVRSFKVGLGGNPVGDKERQGDSKTPEGQMIVGWKLEKSQFHRFLGLSYPLPVHAARALEEKRIDRATAETIKAAALARRPPPQNTALGGDVGIHGGGSSFDWTLGCIAVTDEEIEWLFARVQIGDAVKVDP
ncbi:MAG: L,D-transpeptidase family protein [Myxococcota bacterium]